MADPTINQVGQVGQLAGTNLSHPCRDDRRDSQGNNPPKGVIPLSQSRGAEPGRGFVKGPSVRIVVSFDEETFGEIRQRAIATHQSFAASVRELVEWGLMSDEEGS